MVSALISFLDCGGPGLVNFGSDESVSLGQLLNALQSIFDRDFQPVYVDWDKREIVERALCCCRSRQVVAGWAPFVSLYEGLKN